jgi:hypothetical protein
VNYDEFLERDIIKHIWHAARARRVGPWAVLGVALVHAVVSVPHTKTLPPLVGGRMSMNLFVALVGSSGKGKGGGEAATLELVRFSSEVPPTVPLGSGEGIARTFRPAGTEPDAPNPVDTAIISASEIDTLTALTGRQGSTLSAELRKMYSGETIGFANASQITRSVVKAHPYRACLIAGVQPLRSGSLLAAADGGLPQRFAWLPVGDPDAPEDPPECPGVRTVAVPHWSDASEDLIVPEAAKVAIDRHRLAVLRDEQDADPLDGHALLTRLKIAAAFMALESRTVVDEDHWQMAGLVMAVSARTRAALADKARSVTRARALESADHDEIVSDRKLNRCKQAILSRLQKLRTGDHMARNELRKKVRADLREHFDTAIAELLDSQQICETPLKQGGVAYTCTPRTPASTSENNRCTASTRVPAVVTGSAS